MFPTSPDNVRVPISTAPEDQLSSQKLTDNLPDQVRGHVGKRGGSHCDEFGDLRRRNKVSRNSQVVGDLEIGEVFSMCGLA